ncbi:peptide/nickel transport system permease protein [Amphibacillus marinus]|uniref:Peptide/nickel transport system permease protein n=1 Tax=Amphibacillus marinus TaxID=872970 RepID=A0A1H8M3C3_9BACI|nr:ABC transporter permease [Amphibacillus marinus]SEO11658.1 peptide/nickel transport system permease protein [Amphibacillus marinus]
MTTMQSQVNVKKLARQYKKEKQRARLSRALANTPLLIGGITFIFLILLAILGPLLVSTDPYSISAANRLTAPSSTYWFGTDELGRDLLSRVFHGARVSMFVGIMVAALSSILGLTIGLLASYFRTLDHVLMRICDGLIAIPGILLAIALMAALEPSATNVIIALTIVYTPNIARVVRAAALVVKEQTYIEAMHAQGASHFRIIVHHILPNTLSPLLVQTTFIFADAIISEAALSFLGAGVPAPAPSWGNILQGGRLVIFNAWWVVVIPGIFIVLAVLALNLLGDGLRDFIDTLAQSPTKKKRQRRVVGR